MRIEFSAFARALRQWPGSNSSCAPTAPSGEPRTRRTRAAPEAASAQRPLPFFVPLKRKHASHAAMSDRGREGAAFVRSVRQPNREYSVNAPARVASEVGDAQTRVGKVRDLLSSSGSLHPHQADAASAEVVRTGARQRTRTERRVTARKARAAEGRGAREWELKRAARGKIR